MKLELDSAPDAWLGEALVEGHRVTVRVKSPALRPGISREEVADEALRAIEARWTDVERVLGTDVYRVYTASWAGAGGVPAPMPEFLSKLRLNAINVEVEDAKTTSLFLYFDDGEQFGGHGIEVFIDGESGEIDADLVG